MMQGEELTLWAKALCPGKTGKADALLDKTSFSRK